MAFPSSIQVLFDHMGCLKRYESVQDILKEFFELRLHYYKLRKDWLVGSLGAEATKLSNQARFVLEKIEGKVTIGQEAQTQNVVQQLEYWRILMFIFLHLDRKQIQAGADPHAGAERLRIGSSRCLDQGSGEGEHTFHITTSTFCPGLQIISEENGGFCPGCSESKPLNSIRLRRKTAGTRATRRWILAPRRDQTSTTSSTCLCGA